MIMDESDDDPVSKPNLYIEAKFFKQVVESFDLYINNTGTGQVGQGFEGANELHLLQYPLRPFNRPYGDQGKLLKVEAAFNGADLG